jgi:hypothetical protein
MNISPKRGWLLRGVRNATLPVVALRVGNADRAVTRESIAETQPSRKSDSSGTCDSFLPLSF